MRTHELLGACANRRHLGAVREELALGEHRAVAGDHEIEVELRERVEASDHVGPAAAIGVVRYLRNRVGRRNEIAGDHDARIGQIHDRVAARVAAKLEELDALAPKHDFRVLVVTDLREARVVDAAHALAVGGRHDHRRAERTELRGTGTVVGVVVG